MKIMQTHRVTLIIKKDNLILLVHRIKSGNEYYVFPGGGVEEGESIETAAIREAKEETSLDVKFGKELLSFVSPSDNRTHHCFLITEFSGDLQLGGPEIDRQSESNKYVLEWQKIEDLEKFELYPEELKNKLIEHLKAA